MKTLTAGKNKIEIYESIMELPPHRESLMSYYQLMEVGLGHDWESIDRHHGSILLALNGKGDTMIEDVNQEVENLKMNYWLILNKFNPEHLSFLCLVKSVNDEPFGDLTEQGLIKLGQKLSEDGDAEYVWLETFDEIKKKFPARWLSTFQEEEMSHQSS